MSKPVGSPKKDKIESKKPKLVRYPGKTLRFSMNLYAQSGWDAYKDNHHYFALRLGAKWPKTMNKADCDAFINLQNNKLRNRNEPIIIRNYNCYNKPLCKAVFTCLQKYHNPDLIVGSNDDAKAGRNIQV